MYFFIIIITSIERSLRGGINSYTTKEEYTLAICLMNFTPRHNESIVISSVNSM